MRVTNQKTGTITACKRALTLACLCLGVSLVPARFAVAATVTLPPELAPGALYRVAFVTAALANASSSDIATYNTFVSNQANGSASLAGLGTSWNVLGSTLAVDARTNSGTSPALGGVPIYNLAGQLVASDYGDLWDGTLANPINIDQNGNVVNQKAFTGTGIDGLAITSRQLGAIGDRVQFGESGLTTAGWTTIDWLGDLTGLHYYGISGTLQVVPLPAAVWLFGSALLGLAAVKRRKS